MNEKKNMNERVQWFRREFFDSEYASVWHLFELAPVLPESMLTRAIELALANQSNVQRIPILLSLAQRFPEGSHERDLLLRKVLDDVKSIFEIGEINYLPISATDMQIWIELLQESKDFSIQAEAFDVVRKAREKVRNFSEDYYKYIKVDWLVKLMPIASGAEHSNLINEVFEIIATEINPDLRFSFLKQLSPIVPDAEVLDVLNKSLETMREMEFLHYDSFEYIIKLAQRLPETSREKAFDEILNICREIQDGYNRARSMILLAQIMSKNDRRDLFSEVLSATKSIKDDPTISAVIALMAPFMPDDSFSEAVDAAEKIEDINSRIIALAAFIPNLPPPEKQDVLCKIRDLVSLSKRNIEDRSSGESELIKLTIDDAIERDLALKCLSQPQPEGRPDEDLVDALKISDGYWRSKALGAIATQLPKNSSIITLLSAYEFHSTPRESLWDAAKAGLPPKPGLIDLPRSVQYAIVRKEINELQTRQINTYFVLQSQPDKPLHETMDLQIDQSYYFCVDIGEPKLHLMEGISPTLPTSLPAEARFKIILFDFKDEIQIKPGSDVGELILNSEGIASVLRQPDQRLSILLHPDLTKECLFFPIKSPQKEGTHRLRCNIYYENILIQSRLIHATVRINPTNNNINVLRFDLEYALSSSLWPKHLTKMKPHKLSLVLNSNGDGTHKLMFVGGTSKDSFEHIAMIDSANLSGAVENARIALGRASWGDDFRWNEKKEYRYKDREYVPDTLEKDMIDLAIRGRFLYSSIIDNLAGGRKASKELFKCMIKPGRVQVALLRSPTQFIPAAMFYDYSFDTQHKGLKLCEAFIESMNDSKPLEDTLCFNGECPHCTEKRSHYVCPSGFWGYRHDLGFPVNEAEGTDVSAEIVSNGGPKILVGVATDLAGLSTHIKNLKNILHKVGASGLFLANNRSTILDLLNDEKSKFHLIYFYCHGVIDKETSIPSIKVDGNEYIVQPDLQDIIWVETRPLIFINGCHTAALKPEQIFDLVQPFVNGGGSGVIGTEITIFEPLASDFAEECLKQFLEGGVEIGRAIRQARLKLLKQGNPLGLVYTPFVLPSLHIT